MSIRFSKNRLLFVVFLVGVLSLTSCSFEGEQAHRAPAEGENRLAVARSPYLLQHADNPVHWYPWSEEAFAKAEKEGKPVFLSIGYSTCHWCHVMERESFEDPEIADILNRHFVAIKVDREERPDIDNTYMKAVMALTGSGGWPLSVFLTPEKKPFFGGTYFPPETRWGRPGFREILETIHQKWTDERSLVLESAGAITRAIQKEGKLLEHDALISLDGTTLDVAFHQFQRDFDSQYGGFGRAPKFPAAHNLSLLLRYWKRSGDADALMMVERTLSEMAQGGIYDHLAGGFHRYSTDRRWHVPHFEKMLYDQAVLSRAYLEAYQATGDAQYARIAREIFDYVLDIMTAPDGGFYSAEDADSFPEKDAVEKKEGAFYVWRMDETKDRLTKQEARVFNFYFGVESRGNVAQDPHEEFGNGNILYVAHDIEETAAEFDRSLEDVSAILAGAKEKLLQTRHERPRPHRDEKILTDWNGLMISSFAFGSRVLGEPRYRDAAKKAADFILSRLVRENGRLLHRYYEGDAGVPGNIPDYAFLVHGLIDLYEATFEVKYLEEAERLTGEMLNLFWDDNGGGFFFTADDAEMILFRQKEVYDGALPSGNAIAALDLLRMGRITFNMEWEKKAEALLKEFGEDIATRPTGHAQSLIALDFGLGPSKEIVLAGQAGDEDLRRMVRVLYEHFIPNKVVIFRPSAEKEAEAITRLASYTEYQTALEGRATAYVCTNYQCRFPTSDPLEFEKLLLEPEEE